MSILLTILFFWPVQAIRKGRLVFGVAGLVFYVLAVFGIAMAFSAPESDGPARFAFLAGVYALHVLAGFFYWLVNESGFSQQKRTAH